jgi:hypothetical protein
MRGCVDVWMSGWVDEWMSGEFAILAPKTFSNTNDEKTTLIRRETQIDGHKRRLAYRQQQECAVFHAPYPLFFIRRLTQMDADGS